MRAPLVIGHRGAPGERLEHTRASYRLAIEQGADYIEPDLVPSADGALVARHDAELSRTTDVAERPEFAHRRRTAVRDGEQVTGWLVNDFTVAELKTLRLRERWPKLRPQNAACEGEILTLDEVLDIAADGGVRVMAELKHVADVARVDEGCVDVAQLLLATLARRGLDRAGAAPQVMIESFEVEVLRRLRPLTGLPLWQLIESHGAPPDLRAAGEPTSYADLITRPRLAEVARYADGIAVRADLVIGRDRDGRRVAPSSLVLDAHAAGLQVAVYTLRDENKFLPADLRLGEDPAARGDARAEYQGYYDAGVDAVFTDYAASAVSARRWWWDQRAGAAT